MTGPFHFTCHYDPVLSVIWVIAEGSAQADNVQHVYDQATAAAEKHQCHKLLIDVTNLYLNYDSSTVMQVFQHIDPLLRKMRVARLVTLSEFKHDLIEEFAEEQGYVLKNFEDKEEALAWLHQ
ncbi:hypothetical protein KJY73_02185 [Bowmanella sp. Y26]|uniref:hypothetical protein n=1 Tax=Bowmanella yangjiangensis TaxID=2811230 RepID=UPI001BDCDC0A|nr:hypothetical protein [Bowmanella yangjiangensis]MBT1062359.1 hypothetical protein [Bowmanella yangjiangensis]